ncbi:hypothetical protein ACFQY4_25100 [Catellatospora bangladeshensis]|uniref:hypothetical protein n=1 Tax=Catellatospora bangladeshensis TaxID=310355 RepID=UPI00360F4ABA
MIDDTTLFAGLDTIPWGRMRHAYGRAGEVPALIRGLADPDPAAREEALDAMYGAVHHQGDVYRCTVEAIPFLLRICGSGRAGAGQVVELVASIGGGDHDGRLKGPAAQARDLVTAQFPFWCALAADDEPAVRAAAVKALRACRSRGSDAASFLRARYAEEADPAVRAAIVAAVADLGRARHAAGVAGWVADLLASEPDTRVRLTLFAELNTLPAAAGRLTLDAALDLLDAGYAEHGEPPTPAGFHTATLIGAVRERQEAADRLRSRAALDTLVRAVVNSFGDRVAERTALVTHLLAADDWERRLDAMYPTLHLAQGWRGSYQDVAALAGRQLASPHDELRRRAVRVLDGLGSLAAPPPTRWPRRSRTACGKRPGTTTTSRRPGRCAGRTACPRSARSRPGSPSSAMFAYSRSWPGRWSRRRCHATPVICSPGSANEPPSWCRSSGGGLPA